MNIDSRMRIALRSLALALFFSRAASPAQPVSDPDSALHAIIGNLSGSPLSLSTAVGHALKNATSVRKAEAAYIGARGSVRREAGAFDPHLYFTLNRIDQRLPTASFFSGAPVLATQQTTSQTGLRMSLPIGTELDRKSVV